MKQHNLRISDELMEQIDRERGLIPRNRWLVDLLEGHLAERPAISTVTQAKLEHAKRDIEALLNSESARATMVPMGPTEKGHNEHTSEADP